MYTFYYKVFIVDNFLELNLRSQFHEQSSTALYIRKFHFCICFMLKKIYYANLFEGVVNMRLEAVTCNLREFSNKILLLYPVFYLFSDMVRDKMHGT